MITAIYAIVVFCLIIAIHEFGHFVVAKLVGVPVFEFSIGMGPKIFGKNKNGTEYSLRALPIGGYVKLDGEDEESDNPNAFNNQKPYKRFLVLVAGAMMNFVLGILLFVVIFSFSKGFATNEIGDVIRGSAFEKAGVKKGDVIVKMSGNNFKSGIYDFSDVNYFFYRNGSQGSTKITFKRNGKIFEKAITPTKIDGYEGVMFGFSPKIAKPNPIRVLGTSVKESLFVIKMVITSLVDLIKGSTPVSQVSGPVGIVKEIGSAAKQGILNVMYLAALISINLGVMNLIPFPAFDGGRIMFVIIEMIFRKPVDRQKEAVVHLIGFAILILLMILITYADIMKLI